MFTLMNTGRKSFMVSAVVVGALMPACSPLDGLTPDEYAVLSTFTITNDTPIPASPSNRYAEDDKAAALGQNLFFDKRFSIAGAFGQPELPEHSMSCHRCHDLEHGGADTISPGPTTFKLRRNTPTVFNTAFLGDQFNHWGGQFTALWSIPYTASGASSPLRIAHKMKELYEVEYEDIFGPLPDLSDPDRFPPVGVPEDPEDLDAMNRVVANAGKAVEAFMRRLIDRDSPFDRYIAGDADAMSASAVRGAKLFIGKASCNECHSGPTFSDFQFHNIGVPSYVPIMNQLDYGRAGTWDFVRNWQYNSHGPYSDDRVWGEKQLAKLGTLPTEEVIESCDEIAECGAFKTPSLRSVAKTGPYMHTGNLVSLWDVVEFYTESAGTDRHAGPRDPAIAPLRLDDEEIGDLVSFLESLSGTLPADLIVCPPDLPEEACGY